MSVAAWISAIGASPTGERLARMRRSPHFRRGRFRNPVPTRLVRGSWLGMLRAQLFGGEQRVPPAPMPCVTPAADAFASPPDTGLRTTWLGHSSVLLEVDGARILVDPVLAERSSPVSWAGPRRFHPAPLAAAALPALDAVVVSHDHYDHLDASVVRRLAGRPLRWITALGVGGHLARWGVPDERIVELDWGERVRLGDVDIAAVPARHYSGRGLAGGRTFWSGWTVRGPRHRVYYSGDTGWWDGLPDAVAPAGPFDLTMIKIGSYGDWWPDVHLTPEQAVRLHEAVGGAALLPLHWGTFNLAFHRWDEPPERLLRAAQSSGTRLLLPRPGEVVEPARAPAPVPWWRAATAAPSRR